MSEKLDLDLFNSGYKKIKIGTLTSEVIETLGLGCNPCDILMWHDRLEYIEKHKKDFESEEEYYAHVVEIPNVIQNPDYVGLHPKDNSIQYIKRINKLMLVGVRIKTEGSLNFRSAYPITQGQLEDYIRKGRASEF